MHPLFYRQIIPITGAAFALGASPITFDLPRESIIDKIVVIVDGTISVAANSAAIEGLPALIQNINLRGSLANAPEYNPINSLTGPDMFEAAQAHRGKLPYIIGSLGSAAKFRLTIPIYCRDFFFSDESKNLLTAIPAYLMSTLKLTITPATTAQADVGTGVLALTATAYVEVHQYYRDSIPDNIQFIRPSWEFLQDDSITTSTTRELKFPAGGHYSFMLARSFQAANVKQTDQGATNSAPITSPGTMRIYDLSRFTKVESDFQKLRADNYTHYGEDSLVAGNAAFLWNRNGEVGLFQTGAIGVAQNNVLLQYDATAAANSKIRFVYRRLLDPGNLLNIPLVK